MRMLEELEGLVSSQLGVIKTCFTLTKLEARLAGLSIGPLLISLCLLFVCLVGVWLTSMSMLGYALVWATHSVLIALFCLFIVNGLMFAGLVKYVLYNLKCMSFVKTRAYLSQKKESARNELEKTDKEGSNQPGTGIVGETSAT